MAYFIARRLARRRVVALLVGLGVALNPALFYHECFILYEPLVILFLTASVLFCYEFLVVPRVKWFILLALSLNLLALTRGLYHLVFVLCALLFVWRAWLLVVARLRYLLLIAAILPVFFIYAKNAYLYGFFGASSWQGLNLYRCVVRGFAPQDILDFTGSGYLPAYMRMYSFEHYPDEYRRHGFTKDSTVPLLSRNDFHNINTPDISKAVGISAMKLIREYPLNYLRAVHQSYIIFCQPPSYNKIIVRYTGYFGLNRMLADLIYGKFVTDIFFDFTDINLGSLFYFYLPLLIGIHLFCSVKALRKISYKVEPGEYARHPTILLMVFICIYVTAVGCMFEQGENDRFRFATEPLTLILALLILERVLQSVTEPLRQWLRREGMFGLISGGP